MNSTYNFLFRRLDAMQPLKMGLDAYATRQKVQAANIANSETHGYTARKVQFEEQLQRAMQSGRTRLARTDSGHIPFGGGGARKLDRISPRIVESTAPEKLNGTNNVDIDEEIAEMATNQIQYAIASKVLGQRYRMLKGSITGRMSGV